MTSKTEITAVIFDMDGLMIETEHIHSQAFEHVLRKHGIEPEFNNDRIIHRPGRTGPENWRIFKEKHGLEDEVDSLLTESRAVFKILLLQHMTPKEGLLSLIKKLQENNFKLALGSSASLKRINLILQKFGLFDIFDAIVSGENVKRGKPYPDIYLEVAKKLNINPENCLVLEDAESGIWAAHAAGMKIIAVPNRFTKSHDFSKADRIVNSLKSVTIELINSL
jgi:beta-phosphoglucomutase family hydrolase